MNAFISKWGSIIIATLVTGLLILSIISSAKGVSTWISDTYLPKKYLIVEYGGMRIVMYGQFPGDYLDNDDKLRGVYDEGNFSTLPNRANALVKVIEAFKGLNPIERVYEYPMDISVNSDFNSRQIRSSERGGVKND